jgi:hypothetical protein
MLKKIYIKYLYFALIFFVLALNILFLYHKNRNKEIATVLEKEILNIVSENAFLTEYIFDHLAKKPFKEFFTNIAINQHIKISENNLLVFVFYKNSCTPCLDNEFSNIRKFSEKFGANRIILISDIFDDRAQTILLHENNMENIKLFSLSPNYLTPPFNKFQEKPFYFILDSLCQANMIFVPDLKLKILTEKYYKKIGEKFFN